VEEALVLLEQAAQAFAEDSFALMKRSGPSSATRGDSSGFLMSWAYRMAFSCWFLREQISAQVLDPPALLELMSFDIEVARDRMTA
jgi:hypothetical protein